MKGAAFSISIATCLFCGTYSLISRGLFQVEEPGHYRITAYLGIMYRNERTPRSCGKINTKAGYLFFEALRFAVSQIARNSSYLYGGSLGYRVLNTCKNPLLLTDLIPAGILDPNSVAVLGPPTSDEALFASPIFKMFGIAVISHLATGIDLEDRLRYGNFFRTVPSDSNQLAALLDILQAFNWTYVYVFNSHGNFGEHGMLAFESIIRHTNICIAKRTTLAKRTDNEYFQGLMQALKQTKNVNVVILYTTQEDTARLLMAAKTAGIQRGDYTWIGTASFSVSLREDFVEVADGALFLGHEAKDDKDFQDYLKSLSPQKENFPWLKMFWESTFNCSLAKNATNACTGNESIVNTNVFRVHEPVNAVISAVYTIACGIRTALNQLCPNETVRKQCLSNQSGVRALARLRHQIQKALASKMVNCGEPFPSAKFGNDGSTPGYFNVLNLQYHKGESSVVNIGYWKERSGRTLRFIYDPTKVRFGNGTSRVPISKCSRACGVGEIQQSVVVNSKCCWSCTKCAQNQYILNNTCITCPHLYLPSQDRRSCLALSVEFVNMKSAPSIVILIFCLIGIKLTTVTLGVLLKYWDTRVVKASSRELSTMMIIGLYMCFMAPIVFLAEPTVFVCGVRRFVVGFCLTTCYTPLLLKTNRIHRIFTSAQRGLKRPTFVSPREQIIACLVLIALQCLVAIAWVAGNPPHVTEYVVPEGTYVHKACSQNVVAMAFNLGLCCVLMLICTYFAIKTRNFPKNYNESKSIGITMYLSCFLWGVFIPLYAYEAGDEETAVYQLSIFCVLIAFVTLVGLFGQRVYILLFVKGANNDEGNQTSTSGKNSYNNTNLKITKLTSTKQVVCKCQMQGQIQDSNLTLDLSVETENDYV